MVSLDLEQKSKMVDTEAKTTAVDGSRTRKRPIDPNDEEGAVFVCYCSNKKSFKEEGG